MLTGGNDSSQMREYGDMGIAYVEGPESRLLHVYRASGVGSCVKALVAALMGYEEQRYPKAEKIMEDAAREGNLHERSILEYMREQGWDIGGSQAPFSVRVIPGVIIRGHVDGFGTHEDYPEEEFVVEAKTMSNDRFKLWKAEGWAAFRGYAWQISAYMKATGLRGLYAIKNRNSGEVIWFILDEPPVKWGTIREHLIRAEMAYLKGDLPPCDDVDAGEKFFCPYVYLHDVEEDDDVGLLDDVTGAVIANLAEQHWDLTQKIKPLQAKLKVLEPQRKAVGKDLEPHMLGKKVEAGGFEVTRVDQTRKKLDLATIAEDLDIDVDELKARYEKPYKVTYFKTWKTG